MVAIHGHIILISIFVLARITTTDIQKISTSLAPRSSTITCVYEQDVSHAENTIMWKVKLLVLNGVDQNHVPHTVQSLRFIAATTVQNRPRQLVRLSV